MLEAMKHGKQVLLKILVFVSQELYFKSEMKLFTYVNHHIHLISLCPQTHRLNFLFLSLSIQGFAYCLQ